MRNDKLKLTRMVALAEDILHEAQNNPARLTAFNSPLLGLLMLEVYTHNNPELEQDDDIAKERAKFQGVVEDRRKRESGV